MSWTSGSWISGVLRKPFGIVPIAEIYEKTRFSRQKSLMRLFLLWWGGAAVRVFATTPTPPPPAPAPLPSPHPYTRKIPLPASPLCHPPATRLGSACSVLTGSPSSDSVSSRKVDVTKTAYAYLARRSVKAGNHRSHPTSLPGTHWPPSYLPRVLDAPPPSSATAPPNSF